MSQKAEELKQLSRTLAAFHPDWTDQFLCPTCLVAIPLTRLEDISVAHIVPQSAGGGLKTYLCRKCNSSFGRQQDKWFGEFLRLSKSGKTIFSTTLQHGSFEIDGLRMGGTFRENDAGGLEFVVFDRRTSPNALAALDGLQAKEEIQLRVSLPLLKYQDQIVVGFLTAAYLAWFKQLGYSWVLQNHLDPIRKQIRHPEAVTLTGYLAESKEAFPRLQVGVAYLDERLVLTACLGCNVVLLPSATDPDFYPRLSGAIPATKSLRNLVSLSFVSRGSGYALPPIGVVYEDQLVVLPDSVRTQRIQAPCIAFSKGQDRGRLLRPITKEEADQLAQADNVIHKNIKVDIKIPAHETGRLNEPE